MEVSEEANTDMIVTEEANKEGNDSVSEGTVDEVKDTVQDEVAMSYRTYVVESGDTLRKISEKYFNTELRAKDISRLNELENGDHIYVGQELLIPND